MYDDDDRARSWAGGGSWQDDPPPPSDPPPPPKKKTRVEVFPAYEHETAVRIEFFGDTVEAIKEVDPIRGRVKGSVDRYAIFPG